MGERAARRAGALSWGSWAKAPSWLAGAAAALLLTLPAWVPAVRPDFNLWQVDDGTLHLHRSLFLAQLIRDGNWFPRWMPQEYGGYGYPTLNFYAPGLYYLTLALAFLTPGGLYGGLYSGMQAVTALAALVVILGTYLLAWRLWRHGPAALVAAASVAYAPYVLQGNIFISGSMTHVLGLACMFIGIQMVYFFGPNLKQSWRWITPGAVFAATGILLGSFGFSIYLRVAPSNSATYGSLGAVMTLMLWLYLMGLVLLSGGEINSEIENAAKKPKTLKESESQLQAA